MKKRGGWAAALGEVFAAIRADPMLLAPALLTIGVAAAAALAAVLLSR